MSNTGKEPTPDQDRAMAETRRGHQLVQEEALYIVRSEVRESYDSLELSTISDEGDFITDDPDCLRGLSVNESDEFASQAEYDDWLTDLHVSEAEGEFAQDVNGNWWYSEDGQWFYLGDTRVGTLSNVFGVDGPDDVANLDLVPNRLAYPRRRRHPSRSASSVWDAVNDPLHRILIPRSIADEFLSIDWEAPDDSVVADLTPRELPGGRRLMRLADAIQTPVVRGKWEGPIPGAGTLATIQAIDGHPVLTVLHRDAGRRFYRDVHVWCGTEEYTNISASRGRGVTSWSPTAEIAPGELPDIDDWYVITSGDNYRVECTLSPLGIDHTSGGHVTCGLDHAAMIMGLTQGRAR